MLNLAFGYNTDINALERQKLSSLHNVFNISHITYYCVVFELFGHSVKLGQAYGLSLSWLIFY